MEKKIIEENYTVCDNCLGTGLIDNRKCPNCYGYGLGSYFKGDFLFWGKKINRSIIFQEQLEFITRLAIDSILMLIVAAGFIYLFAQIILGRLVEVDLNGVIKFIFFNEPKAWAFVFWLTILIFLYLFYRFSHESEKLFKINKTKKSSEEEYDSALEWRQVLVLKNKKRLDISSFYSPHALASLKKAYQLAEKMNQEKVEPIHLLASLMSFTKIAVILGRLGVVFPALKERIVGSLGRLPSGKNPELSVKLKKTLIEAYKKAYIANKDRVGVIDLLLAISEPEEEVAEIFLDLGFSYDKIRNVAMWLQFSDIMRNNWRKFKSVAQYKPSGNIDRAMTALNTPFLENYGQNLTTMAKYGYLAPCWGRDEEIDAIFRTMETGLRKNVILVGESGVGKTTIIEGIAQRMAMEEVPEMLKDKRLVSVNLSSLIGGTTADKAQSRLLRIVDEVALAGNVTLVFENIHQLSGVSIGGEQSVDLLSIIANAIKRNYFYCFFSTNMSDYKKYIEGGPLGEVVEKVEIQEVGRDSAIQILEAKSGPIEYKNGIFFSYQAIERAVDLSSRFIHERYLPEKAINILEQAAVAVRHRRGKNEVVSGEDVAEIVSNITSVPLTQVSSEEGEKLLNLESKMHERIVGQDEAVKMVASSLRRARAELRDIKRPIANLLFLGPTGVGKTELAKTVAEVYFGAEKNMIRLDMSEFQEANSINRLIGVGDNNDGLLTEPVRQNPFSLILLDEIEKAEPHILNLFLQVMDDGRLTDGSGRVIDFTSSIIIATSNAGTGYIQEEMKKGNNLEKIKEGLIQYELKSYFKPEFLNRFDGLIVFRPLDISEVIKIADLMVKRVVKNLENRGIEFSITQPALEELAQLGFDPTLGARPMRRVIQERVEDALANYLLGNQLLRRDKVIFDVGGEIRIERPERF